MSSLESNNTPAEEILLGFKRRGLGLARVDDKLGVGPSDALTDDDRKILAERRLDLLALLDDETAILNKYNERVPQLFTQYDGWILNGGDDVMRPDRDGHAVTCLETLELMHSTDVRVLIRPETKAEDAVALLRKIARDIEKDGVYRTGGRPNHRCGEFVLLNTDGDA